MEARSIQEIYDDMRACFIALMGMSGFDDLTLPAWQEGGVLRAIFMSLALEVGQGWMELETVWQTIFATTADKAGLRFHAADWDVDVDESDSEEQLRSQVLARIQMPDIGTPAWYAQECRRQFAEVSSAALIIPEDAENWGYLVITTPGGITTRASLITDIQDYFNAAERKLAGFGLIVLTLDEYLAQQTTE